MIKKTKANRNYRPIELWSKKYYTEKVQPTVVEELSTQNASDRSVRLKVIKKQTRVAFNEESSEVRNMIEEEIKDMKDDAKTDLSDDIHSLTPQEMQQ